MLSSFPVSSWTIKYAQRHCLCLYPSLMLVLPSFKRQVATHVQNAQLWLAIRSHGYHNRSQHSRINTENSAPILVKLFSQRLHSPEYVQNSPEQDQSKAKDKIRVQLKASYLHRSFNFRSTNWISNFVMSGYEHSHSFHALDAPYGPCALFASPSSQHSMSEWLSTPCKRQGMEGQLLQHHRA